MRWRRSGRPRSAARKTHRAIGEGGRLKIALAWSGPPTLDRISFRHEHYVAGFEALGHDVVMVTPRELAGTFGGATVLVPDGESMQKVSTWREIAADVALAVTWHRLSPMLEAITAAGTRVLALADSDGQVGFAAHPRVSWIRIASRMTSARERFRALRYFFRRYAASRQRRDPEEHEFVASTRASHRVFLGSGPAIGAFERFLGQQRVPELAARLREVPFAVPDLFCVQPLPPKIDQAVAIGRWSDPQKDAPLLAAALETYFRASRDSRAPRASRETRVVIFGADAEATFGGLAAREPRLELAGIQEPDVVSTTLARSRVALFSSRWETGPHAATEALALGATLVAPPMPNFEGMIDRGAFGTLASERSPQVLAAALGREMALWESGARDAGAIAAHWRARVSPRAVCHTLLAGLAD
ncbi:MAG: glycosyltransferase [Thermoanaerobaculia bacterium]